MKYRHQNQQDTTITILNHVAYYIGLTTEEMIAKNRARHLVEARMIYCMICNDHAPISINVATIGEVMKRDHATTLYNVKTGKELLRVNKKFASKYERVLESYKSNVLLQFEHYNHIPQY